MLIYLCTTHFSYFNSIWYLYLLSMFLVKNIPLPWQLASGLHINVWAFPYCLLSWYSFNSVYSVGRLQVMGKKSYSSGNFFRNYIKLLPRKFFLDKIYIPGKWLIFWKGCILANISCLQWPSIQHMSKLKLLIGSVDMFHFSFFATSLTTGYWHSMIIFWIPETFMVIFCGFFLS